MTALSTTLIFRTQNLVLIILSILNNPWNQHNTKIHFSFFNQPAEREFLLNAAHRLRAEPCKKTCNRQFAAREPGFFHESERGQLTQPIWIRVQTWLTFKTSITQDLLVVTIMPCTICDSLVVFLPRNSVILKSYILFLFCNSFTDLVACVF